MSQYQESILRIDRFHKRKCRSAMLRASVKMAAAIGLGVTALNYIVPNNIPGAFAPVFVIAVVSMMAVFVQSITQYRDDIKEADAMLADDVKVLNAAQKYFLEDNLACH